MPPNLCPSERAIGISRQERDGVPKISLPPQEDLEGRLLRLNDGPSFAVVALLCKRPLIPARGRAETSRRDSPRRYETLQCDRVSATRLEPTHCANRTG